MGYGKVQPYEFNAVYIYIELNHNTSPLKPLCIVRYNITEKPQQSDDPLKASMW